MQMVSCEKLEHLTNRWSSIMNCRSRFNVKCFHEAPKVFARCKVSAFCKVFELVSIVWNLISNWVLLFNFELLWLRKLRLTPKHTTQQRLYEMGTLSYNNVTFFLLFFQYFQAISHTLSLIVVSNDWNNLIIFGIFGRRIFTPASIQCDQMEVVQLDNFNSMKLWVWIENSQLFSIFHAFSWLAVIDTSNVCIYHEWWFTHLKCFIHLF